MKLFDTLIEVGKLAGAVNPLIGIAAKGIELITDKFSDDPEACTKQYRLLGYSHIKIGLAMLEAAEDGEISDQELKQIKELSSDET